MRFQVACLLLIGSTIAGGCSGDPGGEGDVTDPVKGDPATGPAGSPAPNATTASDADAGSPAAPGMSGGDGGTAATCPVNDPGKDGDGNVNIGPTYKDAPEMTAKAGVPKGTVFSLTMASSKSKIYPGLTGAYTRKVSVYVPKQYVDGTPAPFMVVQDGSSYATLFPPALDNLIASKSVPPMVVVFVDSGGGDGRGSERGLEYDCISDDYVDFVETEVLPVLPADATIQKTYKHLTFTKDPEGRATMGGSSGGAAAFTMGWFRPDLYHRIFTYSGTFVNQCPTTAYPASAWEYHQHLIADDAAKPLRVFLEVGEKDNDLDAKFGDGEHDWVAANKAMAAKLGAKGYHYRFAYAAGAVHVDKNVVKQTFPQALVWLWRGYRPCDL